MSAKTQNRKSRQIIPEKVKTRLWVLAGGRCQYEGCNKPLWQDSLTMAQMNTSYIAHIVAAAPDGPRGDAKLSPRLVTELSNLMLMCDEHHRLIDREDVAGHPVERLEVMKRAHENRIETLTSIQADRRSHVVLYCANVGQHQARVDWDRAAQAMVPRHFPAERPAIELGLGNSAFQDHEEEYWLFERENLRRQFNRHIASRITARQVNHFSIFACSPMPLLIELGRLFSDIPAADVYQLHREPSDWIWQDHPHGFSYLIDEPDTDKAQVALILSLTATIIDARIHKILGEDVSIWRFTISGPDRDFLKSPEQLKMFRQEFRRLLDQIKARHGQDVVLHVFPAVPVSVAVEIGRVWMSKADLPLCIYDENRRLGGFVKCFTIPDSPIPGD